MLQRSADVGPRRIDGHVRWAFAACGALVVAFVVSLMVRSSGSYVTPIDGWGVDAFELAVGGLAISRYLEPSWRSNRSAARVFPLILGGAGVCWALGDVALTLESLGGATPSIPSAADGFYVLFFPLAYISFMMLIRRGRSGSLRTIALDGLVVGLGVASISAAYFFEPIARASGGSSVAAAVNMIYPSGDLLLLALAIGSFAVLPREYRRFFGIVSLAMVSNAVGDMFNLLQPNSHLGYVANGAAWPISLLMLAIATWAQPSEVNIGTAERSRGFVLPAVCALAAMFILVSATLGTISKAGVGLATATLLVAGIRLTLTSREGQALKTARFRSLIDNARDLIVVAEVDFQVAYITPSSLQVLGYPVTELQGRCLTDIVHPDDAGQLVAVLEGLPNGGLESTAFEVRMRHFLGAWRVIAGTATNLLADPSVGGYVINGTDVTEVRQATEDLAAAHDSALSASQAKSQFLSTMSHEIRTPMNGVIGLTELLMATDLDLDQRELAAGVKVSAENLLVIINDILDFSKIEAGKLEIDETVIDLHGVVDDVGRILAGAAQDKDVELLIDVSPDVPSTLMGDAIRIQQVLLNLTANAVKFTTDGEVVIRLLVLHGNVGRVAIRFEVIDTGIGIADADRERLFSAFAQADSSTTRKFGGTGLGLTICRQLVELMGGTLDVASTPGEGSTFWFELSLGRVEASPAHSLVAADDLTGLAALVVDDNATNRKILRQQLHSWGVDVDEASDGHQAAQLAAAVAADGRAFDLGVIDLNMPGMDGLQLAQILKSVPSTASTRLFLLSSSGTRLSAAESHLRGFDASLTKPVRASELFDVLITGAGGQSPAEPGHNEADRAIGITGSPRGIVLLVEDNRMNQLVGSKVLTKLGYEFEIAVHGGEAVAAISERRFDAVLMDCQMPEMDGYEATAQIRRIEGTSRHTPIIAMTAAAMAGDRDACLAAGMDDYVTKPVRMESVEFVLDRWITGARPDGARLVGPVLTIGPSPEPLDHSQIQLLWSLDDGEGVVLGNIVEQYLAETEEIRTELVRAVDTGDARSLEHAAHTIKGASANVGASAVAAVCAELELRAKSTELDHAADLVVRFDAEFARVRDALTILTPVV